MKVASHARLRFIAWPQWSFFAFTLLVILPAVFIFASLPAPYHWYLQEFVEPELEEALGFRGGEVQLTRRGETYPIYAVIAVRRGGVFDSAGVVPGDIPFGYMHGARS